MSGAVFEAIAFLRRLARFPSRAVFNVSGQAGPRRLAMIGLAIAAVLALVVVVVLSGRSMPSVSRDARLKQIDPLPGGLHSTPEQDALALSATDAQADRAKRQGVSYTPAMAPSQPAQPPQPVAPPAAATPQTPSPARK